MEHKGAVSVCLSVTVWFSDIFHQPAVTNMNLNNLIWVHKTFSFPRHITENTRWDPVCDKTFVSSLAFLLMKCHSKTSFCVDIQFSSLCEAPVTFLTRGVLASCNCGRQAAANCYFLGGKAQWYKNIYYSVSFTWISLITRPSPPSCFRQSAQSWDLKVCGAEILVILSETLFQRCRIRRTGQSHVYILW